jgi:tetratricopeptide (TPR) repeat protein/predicted Ser/Thr protein kinase
MNYDRLKEFIGTDDRETPGVEPRVGKYRILREIARGGTATVYEAVDPDLGRPVAVKVLRVGEIDRLRLEATAVARLRHPNIIAVHEVGVDFIVMDYVAGPTLAEAMLTMPLVERVKVLETVARAVEHAHRNGVVHRDLKPGNIIIDAEGRVVLTDFGLAKIAGGEDLTVTGGVMGTPRYMAPEQVRGKGFGPSVDIWALGVTLYEMLSAQHPFHADTPLEIYHRITRDQAPLLPGPLGAIAAKALEKDPARRYPSAEALADDLARYLRGTRVDAPRVSVKLRRRAPVIGAALLIVALPTALYLERRAAVRAARDQGKGGLLGSTAEMERRFRAAEEEATAALERNPRSFRHLMARSQAYEARADHARDHGGNPLPDYAAAEQDATRAIEVDPRSTAAHYQRARIRTQRAVYKGKYGIDPLSDCDAAEDDLSRAGDDPRVRAWHGNLQYHRSLWLKKTGKDPTGYLETAELDLTPARDAETLARRGRVRAALGKFDGAERDFIRALALQPTSAWTWSRRGEARREAGDLAAARAHLDKAISLDEVRADPLEQRGHVHFAAKNWPAALADYRRAVELNPALGPLLAEKMREAAARAGK